MIIIVTSVFLVLFTVLIELCGDIHLLNSILFSSNQLKQQVTRFDIF